MEPKVSLPSPQEPGTGPNPEPDAFIFRFLGRANESNCEAPCNIS
jgi:hypothetical protein